MNLYNGRPTVLLRGDPDFNKGHGEQFFLAFDCTFNLKPTTFPERFGIRDISIAGKPCGSIPHPAKNKTAGEVCAAGNYGYDSAAISPTSYASAPSFHHTHSPSALATIRNITACLAEESSFLSKLTQSMYVRQAHDNYPAPPTHLWDDAKRTIQVNDKARIDAYLLKLGGILDYPSLQSLQLPRFRSGELQLHEFPKAE